MLIRKSEMKSQTTRRGRVAEEDVCKQTLEKVGACVRLEFERDEMVEWFSRKE